MTDRADRKATYQKIQEEHAETGTPLSTLCKRHAVTYQAYHAWETKQEGGPARVAILIPLTEVLEAVKQKKSVIHVTLKALLGSLTAEQKKTLYQEWGRIQLERTLERWTGGIDGEGDGEYKRTAKDDILST